MKTRETTPGKTYSVHTVSGCTVSDKNGWSKQIDATDGYFTAHVNEVHIDGDDDADVREVFKVAAAVGLSGSSSGVKIEGDHLFWNADKTILSVRLDNVDTWPYALAYSNIEELNIPLPKITDGAYFCAYCPKLKKVDTDLSTLTSAQEMFKSCPLESINTQFPVLKTATGMFYGTSIKIWNIDLPELTNGSTFLRASKTVEFHGNLDKLQSGGDFFYSNGVLRVFAADLPALTGGHDMFISAQLDKASALRILTTIPAYTTGSRIMSIGIHVDYKNDEEVLAAIEEATNKNWTMEVRWNGTATAAAYGLRRTFDQPVYAKMEVVNGEQRFKAAHELHSPDGLTPEEMGYELFDSLEAAQEKCGLIHYANPEQEEILTEGA